MKKTPKKTTKKRPASDDVVDDDDREQENTLLLRKKICTDRDIDNDNSGEDVLIGQQLVAHSNLTPGQGGVNPGTESPGQGDESPGGVDTVQAIVRIPRQWQLTDGAMVTCLQAYVTWKMRLQSFVRLPVIYKADDSNLWENRINELQYLSRL
jgi:hypothetical protein